MSRPSGLLHDVTVRHLGTVVARFLECSGDEAQRLVDHWPLAPGDVINQRSYYPAELESFRADEAGVSA